MMNKRLLNNVLYGALLFSLGTGVVSCKDYDDDIEGLNNRITTVESDMERFKEKIEEGGFILAHWDGTTETEEKIKEETKATIRCIPFDSFVPGDKEPGKCMVTGKPSACRVIFARSY